MLDEERIIADKPDEEIYGKILKRWDSLAIPIDGLGLLEKLIARIGAIEGTCEPEIDPAVVVTFCGDHGITAAGVSQTDSSVTRSVAGFLGKKESSLGYMSVVADCDTVAVDVGISGTAPIPGVLDRKIREGTRDFRYEPAMTPEETRKAVNTGIEMAEELAAAGYRILIPGEMGIGNTTAATAMLSAYTGIPAEAVTGAGAGLNEEGLKRKKEAINIGLERWRRNASLNITSFEAAVDILSNFGGYELAAMAGLCIGGAICHIPVILDGYLSAAAGLAAERMEPGVCEYLIASHSSREPGAEACLRELHLKPLIYGGFRLGEGTGALMLLPMLRMANAVYRKMISFEGTDIPAYDRYDINRE